MKNSEYAIRVKGRSLARVVNAVEQIMVDVASVRHASKLGSLYGVVNINICTKECEFVSVVWHETRKPLCLHRMRVGMLFSWSCARICSCRQVAWCVTFNDKYSRTVYVLELCRK